MERTEHFLTAEELAEHLRVRPSTVRRWSRQRQIPTIHLTKRVVRFDLEAVINAIRAARAAAVREEADRVG